jgi:prepilin-type processing-associated H-X9-DG protein
MNIGSGYKGSAVYNVVINKSGYVCGDPWAENFGIKSLETVMHSSDILDGGTAHPLNAVGRHHPGGDDTELGGTANFLYADNHVERKSVKQTIKKAEWGKKFYSITGKNTVRYYREQIK